MTTVDFRTRFRGSEVALDAAAFCDDTLPSLLTENGRLAARGYSLLELTPLGLEIGDARYTLVSDGDTLAVRAGLDDDAVVAVLTPDAFSELVQETSTTLGLGMRGRVEMRRGTMDEFVAWEPVLRALFDGRPVHEAGMVELLDADGTELDLHGSFTLSDPHEQIGEFLAAAGFVKIRDVFEPDEMSTIVDDLADAVAEARRDDGQSWWARDGKGEWYAARILAFNEKSPTLRKLLLDERFEQLGALTDDRFEQRDPDNSDAAEGLTKHLGVTDGISDLPWHKDCSPGGHSYGCCGLTVGICLTPADRDSGELGVVAGSHRANVQGAGVRAGLDLPRVPLPAETGDVTIHCSCTLHMSRPPVARERRVVYTGFGLAPRPGDVVQRVDRDAIRRARADLDDAGRRLNVRGYGNAVQQFDLDG
ncbi:MAG TPA: phytanoyl-CoA dioxygenase family protein [Acidimicrobiia bacterium]|nr:phytanoyl-CoA dioxygenase family protein [Acidimicrobiia bacterium]